MAYPAIKLETRPLPSFYSKLTAGQPSHRSHTARKVLNCFWLSASGLINNGGESKGSLRSVPTPYAAVVNKRAGGMGMIVGRKAFQRPSPTGVDHTPFHALDVVHWIKDV